MPKLLLQVYGQELHNRMVITPEEYGMKESRDEEKILSSLIQHYKIFSQPKSKV